MTEATRKSIHPSHGKLERFGFSFERGGAHTSRTLMLQDLRALLAFVRCPEANKKNYTRAIEDENCLGKRSARTRSISYRHMADLYSLDPSILIFRAMLFFWHRDSNGQPLLALLCAYTRDPVLRSTAPFVLGLPQGATVSRISLEEFIDELEPGRFSKATLKSTAQNISSTWTQSGHFAGRVRKIRSRASPTAGDISLALFLGYLTGIRGEALFRTAYMRILDCSPEHALELAEEASRKGWIILKRVGNVIEVLFPRLINDQEMEWANEQN